MKFSVGKKGLALVLCGGAARAIAHLGILQALDEEGIRPAIISGVSGGAIVGAFYCNGYSPQEIIKLIKNTSVLNMFSPAWGTGFLKLDKAEKIFNEYLGKKTFEKLNIPLVITTCDVNKAENVTFSGGDIIPPLLATCSVPPLFKPVEHCGRRLVDGGILNNLPVGPVKDYKRILGVNVNVINTSTPLNSTAQYTERVVDMIINNNIQDSIKLCSLFLEPPEMKYFHLTDIGKADEMFAVGYDFTKKNIDKIRPLS